MKNLLLHSLITILTCLSLPGQQNQAFRGKVLYLNSGGQPAIGVQVSGKTLDAANSNIVYTTAAGDFSLLFPWAKNGQRINIEVGKDDARGQTIEVVNIREIEQCRMPANGTDVFEVIVCVQGTRERVAQKYYHIIRNSTMKEIERLRREVKQMILAKTQDYVLIGELTEKITKLQEQTDSISLYREAYRMASINRDNATARMVKYLELLEQGESIEEALKVLDSNKASEELERNIQSFGAGIEELLTKANGEFFHANYSEAIALYQTIITHCQNMGIDPVIEVGYGNELAKALLFAGRRKEALELQQEVVATMEEKGQAEGIVYARAITNLAFLLEQNGQYKKAMQLNQTGLKLKNNLLDSLDQEFVFSYNNIGRNHIFLGQPKSAKGYFQKALSIAQAQPESNNNMLAKLFNHLSVAHRHLGEIEQAVSLKQQSYSILKEIYGEEHPVTLACQSDLQVIHYDLGLYDTVVVQLKKIIPLLENSLGVDHLDLMDSYNTLALTYVALGQFEEAENYYAKTLRVQEMALDSNHTKLANTYNNIGTLYQEHEQYTLAKKWLEKALAIEEKFYANDNGNLGRTYNNLAVVYEKIGQFDDALDMQMKSIELLKNSTGEFHPNVSTGYSNLSLLYVSLGRATEALQLVDKAIHIDTTLFGSTNMLLTYRYNNKACVLKGLDRNEEALAYDLKALAIFEKYFDVTHPNYALFQSALGKSYAKTGRLEEAKQAFRYLIERSPESYRNYQNWGMYYTILGEEELALTNLEKAISSGFSDVGWLKYDSTFDKIRRKPAFKSLVRKLEQRNYSK